VIEFVDRFEAQNQRRIPMLFQDDRGRQCRLEAVGGAMPDD